MATLGLAKLINRKLLKISGPDCYPYLQGLLCNDLRHLYEPDRIPKRKHARNSSNVLSTFMLNAQGRAICDLLIYRTALTRHQCQFTPPGKATDPDELLIECDSKLASGLANTLYGYRVRRKISISIQENLNVWSLIPGQASIDQFSQGPASGDTNQPFDSSIIDIGSSLTSEIVTGDMIVVNDPRISALGLRIVSGENDPNQLKRRINSFMENEIVPISSKEYTLYRYCLGIGEGSRDHPESNCLPLECNADFLGSVSFTKGCYLGQELTARIHTTGVVRKRLMPIVLHRNPDDTTNETTSGSYSKLLLDNSDIVDESGKRKVGVMRHAVGDRALALLRCDLAINGENLKHEISGTKISTYIPHWWDIKSSSSS